MKPHTARTFIMSVMCLKNTFIIRIIGVGIFVYVLHLMDWRQIISSAKELSLPLLVVAFVLNIPLLQLKSFRWKELLNMQGRQLSGRDALLYYLSSVYLGIITPGRLGEFAKVYFLKKANVSTMSHGISSVLIDRFHDLYLLLLLGTWGLIAAAAQCRVSFIAGWGGLFLLLCLLPLVLLFKGNKRGSEKLLDKMTNTRISSLIAIDMDECRQGFKELMNFRLWKTFGITIIAFFILYLQYYLIMLAVRIPITYWDMVPVMALAELVSLIPITIAGLGTREATMLYLLIPKGIGMETILLFSIGVLIVSFVGGAFVCAIAWWKMPLAMDDFGIKKG
jgi:uncharacterized protein (TIRG00374 family)